MKRLNRFSRGPIRLAAGCALAILVAWTASWPRPASAAVTIQSFTGSWQQGEVVLNWTTATELDNQGFNILRAIPPEGDFVQINAALIPSHCIGQVVCGNPNYTYTDGTAVPNQPYWYSLESVSLNNSRDSYGPICVAPAGLACLPPTATRTATATKTQAPAVDPTETPTPTATLTQAPSSGGQSAATQPSAPTDAPTALPSATLAATQDPTRTPAPGLTRAPTRTPTPPAPAESGGEVPSGGGLSAAPSATPGEPRAATEPPQPSATAGSDAIDALPTRFTFATATLLPSATVAVAEAGGEPAGEPVDGGPGGAVRPGGLPLGVGLGAALALALLLLVVLPVLGYYLWQHARR